MNVLILGATGTLGTALTKKLMTTTKEHLTLFARHADRLKPQARTRIMVGNALERNDLRRALKGQNVVFCAISGKHLPQVANNLVELMPEEKVDRLIFMGAVGIYNEIPDEMDGKDNLVNNQAQLPNRKAVDIIESSNLNYTIIRPGFLRAGKEDDFVLTIKGEKARGYIATVPSLLKFATHLISNDKMYSRRNISITRDLI